MQKTEESKTKAGKMKSYPVAARITADIVGVKPDTVHKQRAGKRTTGQKAKMIAAVDQLLNEKQNLMIEEVKRIVTI